MNDNENFEIHRNYYGPGKTAPDMILPRKGQAALSMAYRTTGTLQSHLDMIRKLVKEVNAMELEGVEDFLWILRCDVGAVRNAIKEALQIKGNESPVVDGLSK